MITAFNTKKLAMQLSILVLLWVKIADGRNSPEFLIAQARLKLSGLGKYQENDEAVSHSFSISNLCMSNKLVGKIHSKIKFTEVTK